MTATADLKARLTCKVVKTDASRRLVFGHMIICKHDDGSGLKDYVDTDGSSISEDVMLDAALDWAREVEAVKAADVNHDGNVVGSHPFFFPMTEEIAAAYGIKGLKSTGLMVAQQVDAATFKRAESGELTGFSIESDGPVEFF